MRPRVTAALLVAALAGCTSAAGPRSGAGPTRTPAAAAAELAGGACGHRADRGGPPAPTPIGRHWQPTVSAYDAARHFAVTSEALAGRAAALDPAWAPLATAWGELTDVYDSAREEYAAVLAHRDGPVDRAGLRQLQAVATRTLATITAVCAGAP